jgi:hypothetical protein
MLPLFIEVERKQTKELVTLCVSNLLEVTKYLLTATFANYWQERLENHLRRSLRIDQIIICLSFFRCDYPLGQGIDSESLPELQCHCSQNIVMNRAVCWLAICT